MDVKMQLRSIIPALLRRFKLNCYDLGKSLLRFDLNIWIHSPGLSIFLLESTCELIHSFGGPSRVSTHLMNGENEFLWIFASPSATSYLK